MSTFQKEEQVSAGQEEQYKLGHGGVCLRNTEKSTQEIIHSFIRLVWSVCYLSSTILGDRGLIQPLWISSRNRNVNKNL